MELRHKLIAAGLSGLAASGAARLFQPLTSGRGALLMFHHVRPWRGDEFAPNRLLEITPEFLETVIIETRRAGFEIIGLDEGVRRLSQPVAAGARPFAVFTFDDGYRDNAEIALPVLERHDVPFTLYVTTGFADRTARLWWRELEGALRHVTRLRCRTAQGDIDMPAATAHEKQVAFRRVYWALRAGPEADLLETTGRLFREAGGDSAALVEGLCLDWDGLAAISRHRLCTIGVHTLTHPRLAKLTPDEAQREMAQARDEITRRLQVPGAHLSYPVGDPSSAGPREFALARELGFSTAVTTRPGMVMAAHAGRMQALPRLSVNGLHQSRQAFGALLSGLPFALMNRFQPA
ncbi:MAG: polysaccharide deacetylase family protein [Hyphomicrobiales bacterium]|nr:polysaccharide deacetylase family protein [Hyphomicrobiales bacterium]